MLFSKLESIRESRVGRCYNNSRLIVMLVYDHYFIYLFFKSNLVR